MNWPRNPVYSFPAITLRHGQSPITFKKAVLNILIHGNSLILLAKK